MTDLEAYKKMLTSSGHGYSERKDQPWRFTDTRLGHTEDGKANIPCVIVAVDGRFYDSLLAAFDEEGHLLQLHSHVCEGLPTKAFRAFLEKTGQ